MVVTSGMAKCLRLTRETAAPVLMSVRFAAEARAAKYNKSRDPLAGKKRKLVLYVIFLLLFAAVSVGARPSVLYQQNALVTSLFNLPGVESCDSWASFDNYLDKQLLPSLHNPVLLPGGGHPLQLVSGYEIKQWRVSATACDTDGPRRPISNFAYLGHHVVQSDGQRWGGCSTVFSEDTEERAAEFGSFGEEATPRRWRYSFGGRYKLAGTGRICAAQWI